MDRVSKLAIVLDALAIAVWLFVFLDQRGGIVSLGTVAAFGMAIGAIAAPQKRIFLVIAMVLIVLTGALGIFYSVLFFGSDGWTGGVVTKYAISLATVVLMVIAPFLSAYMIWGKLRKSDT